MIIKLRELWKVEYSCGESGCSGHNKYFLYKKNAEGYYDEIKGKSPKLEKVAVDVELNVKIEETGAYSGLYYEYSTGLLEKILRDAIREAKKAKKK